MIKICCCVSSLLKCFEYWYFSVYTFLVPSFINYIKFPMRPNLCRVHMFICKLRTPYKVYLAYRRQTENVVTCQTFDRAPRLTTPPTAHISRGDIVVWPNKVIHFYLFIAFLVLCLNNVNVQHTLLTLSTTAVFKWIMMSPCMFNGIIKPHGCSIVVVPTPQTDRVCVSMVSSLIYTRIYLH